MKKIIGILLALILIVGGVYYFQNSQKDKQKAETTEKQEKEVIKIGAILPLTGPISAYGKIALSGEKKAIEYLNSNTNKHFELIVQDGKTGGINAINAYRKIMNENIKYLTAVSSNIAIPILDNVVKDSILMFAGSSNPIITNPIKNLVFRHFVSAEQEVTTILKDLEDKKNKSTTFIIVEDDFGNGFANALKEKISKQIEYNILFYNKKETNPNNILTKTREINNKNLVVVGYKSFVGNLVKKVKELKLDYDMYCSYSFILTKADKIAGKEAMKNVKYIDIDVDEEMLNKYNLKKHEVLDYATIRIIGDIILHTKNSNDIIEYIKNIKEIDCGIYVSKLNHHNFYPKIVLKKE